MQIAWLDWLATRQAQQAARLVTLLFGLMVVYLLARLTWMLVPTPVSEQAPPPPATTSVKTAQAKQVDAARIAAWHLFGEAKVVASQPEAPIDAPETHLNLILRGVLATDDKVHARAIIAAPDGMEKSYGIGDNLPGGAELRDIYPDRIILLRNGRHETLRLPKDQLGGAAGGVAPSQASVIVPEPQAAQTLRQYRQLMDSNPRSLIDLVRPVPASENNRFVGFRLYPGTHPELFRQFGLRPGDLLTAVNGVGLDSAAKGVEVLQTLRNTSSLSLQIQRGGRDMSLTMQIP